MIVSTKWTQEEVDRFEQLPEKEQERQITFAMLAKLGSLEEWFSGAEIYDLYGELASET